MASAAQEVKSFPWMIFIVGILLGAFILGAPLMAIFMWARGKFKLGTANKAATQSNQSQTADGVASGQTP